MRGYFGIAVYHPKTAVNIGTLWRTANLMGAKFIATIGRRYQQQASDTLKTIRHVPMFEYDSFEDFYSHLPYDCRLWGVELDERAQMLGDIHHPQRVCYLLGAEDGGLPEKVLLKCHQVIKIDTPMSLNLAVAGSIVMYDRKSRNKTNPTDGRMG